MTSRGRHTEVTRQAILDAAYELLIEKGGTDFPVQAVADRTGVTHRTVYRYFASREDLLITAAVSRIFPDQARSDDAGPTTLVEWIEGLSDRFDRAEDNFRLLRQVLGGVLASDEYVQREGEIADRFKFEWELFRAEFPHLGKDTAHEQFAVFREIGSSMTYISYRTDYGLSAERASELIQTTLREMVKRLGDAGDTSG